MAKVLDLKKGVTLKKGNRKRTFLGIEYNKDLAIWNVIYSVPSDMNNHRIESVRAFNEWAEKAEFLK